MQYPNSDGTWQKCRRITHEFIESSDSINELHILKDLVLRRLSQVDLSQVDTTVKIIQDPRPLGVSLLDKDTGEYQTLTRHNIRIGQQYRLAHGQRAWLVKHFGALPSVEITVLNVLVDEETQICQAFHAQSSVAVRYAKNTLKAFWVKSAKDFFESAHAYEDSDFSYTSDGTIKVVKAPKETKKPKQSSADLAQKLLDALNQE